MQEVNSVLLDRPYLTTVLDDLSRRLLSTFGSSVRLVIHGGAVMVLHRSLSHRPNTRDVDYCHRAFVAEMAARGVPDAGQRLLSCIIATAKAFGLGKDWMNAHADVALPWAIDPRNGQWYDPIYHDAVESGNLHMNTVYTSPGLTLIGVSWSWAVALKLVRYAKDDPTDIAAILALGYRMNQIPWTREVLETWIKQQCKAMNYDSYSPADLERTRMKMRDAVVRAQRLLQTGHWQTPQPTPPGYYYHPPTVQPAATGGGVHASHPSAWAGAEPPVIPDPSLLQDDTYRESSRSRSRSIARGRSASRPRTAFEEKAAVRHGASPVPMPVPSIPHAMGASFESLKPRSRRSSSMHPTARAKPLPGTPHPFPTHMPDDSHSLSGSTDSRPSSIVSVLSPESLRKLPAGFIPTHFFPSPAMVSAF